MRKPKEPWYRQFNDTWYVSLKGEQIPLARGKDNKAEALRAFYKLMATGERSAVGHNGVTTVAILDLFLEHSQKHNSPRTYEWYRDFLQDFADAHGLLPVASLKPFHVTRWLDAHPKWTTARRGAITCVKRASNWAVDEGLIETNPLKSVKKPPMPRRERVLTPQEQDTLYAGATDEVFRQFLFALRESGARPGEVSRVTAAHVDLKDGTWTFAEHKTKHKTQKPRVVYLTPGLSELTRGLMAQHPTGPLFRDSKGNAWNRNSIRCRFRRMRKRLKLGNDVVAYLYRHGFATDALANGVPVASVAELLGHSDLQMISKHYGHLAEKRKHLQEMARKATGKAE